MPALRFQNRFRTTSPSESFTKEHNLILHGLTRDSLHPYPFFGLDRYTNEDQNILEFTYESALVLDDPEKTPKPEVESNYPEDQHETEAFPTKIKYVAPPAQDREQFHPAQTDMPISIQFWLSRSSDSQDPWTQYRIHAGNEKSIFLETRT